MFVVECEVVFTHSGNTTKYNYMKLAKLASVWRFEEKDNHNKIITKNYDIKMITSENENMQNWSNPKMITSKNDYIKMIISKKI